MSTATLDEARAAARSAGLAAGLRRVLARSTAVPCSAGGRAFLPAGWSGNVPAWHLPGGTLPRADARVRRHLHPLAGTCDLELVEVSPLVCTAVAPHDGPDFCPAGELALLGVRIGTAERALDQATEHLAGRTSGGAPMIRYQLPPAAIADAVTELELCAAYRSCPADAHDRLCGVEQSIAGLFGGSGYLCAGPATSLYMAALVASTWTPVNGPGRRS